MFSFQFSDLTDILIVVSRWYGGIHLGADRFKDYSNAARNLINHLELIQNPVSTCMINKVVMKAFVLKKCFGSFSI